MPSDSITTFARHYASTRLRELDTERAEIVRLFPDLARATVAPGAVASSAPAPARKPMSAAQRKLISARMSRYWQERRAAKAKKAAPKKASNGK
jgi:hypothetical protein